MIGTKLNKHPISLITRGFSDVHMELSRLLSAAVISPGFCQSLLDNPELALKNGFQGEEFFFTEEERDLIFSIRADSLADLANQLARTFGNWKPVNGIHPVQPVQVFGF
jgi:hypothetical protein